MSCNTSKCKELCMAKKGVTSNFPPVCGIEQNNSLSLLGVTLQNDCKFSSHVKGKLREANKYLYILTRTQPLICVGCFVHYWVPCAINRRGFFEIAFVVVVDTHLPRFEALAYVLPHSDELPHV